MSAVALQRYSGGDPDDPSADHQYQYHHHFDMQDPRDEKVREGDRGAVPGAGEAGVQFQHPDIFHG